MSARDLAIVLMALLAIASPAAAGQVADAALPRSSVITNPDWRARPNGDDVARYYPDRAMREGLSGRATIRCAVSIEGRLEQCVALSESPTGYDFATAALQLSTQFKMRPRTEDGRPVAGGTVTIPVVFRVPGMGTSPQDQPARPATAPTAEGPPPRPIPPQVPPPLDHNEWIGIWMERILGVLFPLGLFAVVAVGGWFRLNSYNDREAEMERDRNALSRLLGRD